MRKIIVLIFAFGTLVTSAQIQQGTIMAGASSNLGFRSYKPDGSDNISTFNISVDGGYFVMDNLAFGLNLGLSTSDNGTYNVTQTSIGAFGRYYIQGKFFLGAGYSGSKYKSKYDGGSSESSSNTVSFEGGYAAFITDNIAIEPALNYNIISGDQEGSSFGLAVGFMLYFNR